LRAAGLSVIVLEGRDRVGGRLWTRSDLANSPLDFGGQFIHRAEDNPITGLTKHLRIPTHYYDLGDILLHETHGSVASDERRVADAEVVTVVTAGEPVKAQALTNCTVSSAASGWDGSGTPSAIPIWYRPAPGAASQTGTDGTLRVRRTWRSRPRRASVPRGAAKHAERLGPSARIGRAAA
jgi:monoamine oxidase